MYSLNLVTFDCSHCMCIFFQKAWCTVVEMLSFLLEFFSWRHRHPSLLAGCDSRRMYCIERARAVAQEQWVLEFAEQWDDYDWTKQLA